MESKERVGWGFQLKVRATTTQTSLQSRTGEYTRFPRAKNLEVHPLSTPSESSNSRKPAYNKIEVHPIRLSQKLQKLPELDAAI